MKTSPPVVARALAALALSLVTVSCGSREVDAELEPWLVKAREMGKSSRAQLEARWGAPMAESWGRDPLTGERIFIDLHHAKLFWITKNRIDLVADVQLVGTYKFHPEAPKDRPDEAGSWEWSWYNDKGDVPDVVREKMPLVRRWGNARRSLKFTKGAFVGPRHWAEDLCYASARILGAVGTYTISVVGQDIEFFFILQEVRKPKKGEEPLPPPSKKSK